VGKKLLIGAAHHDFDFDVQISGQADRFGSAELNFLPCPLWIPGTMLNGPPWLNKIYFTAIQELHTINKYMHILDVDMVTANSQ